MHRLTLALALALAATHAAPASAGVIFSQTVLSQGGTAYLDAAFEPIGGELWAKASGGTLDWAWINIQGDFLYAWWVFGGYDEDGNVYNYLVVNNSPADVSCSWSYSAVGACDFNGTVDRGLLHATVPPPPLNYDRCFPWDGTYEDYCMNITTYSWTLFSASASAPDGEPVTFAIYDTNPGVPEPATWALLLAGFGLTGAAMRSRGYSSRGYSMYRSG